MSNSLNMSFEIHGLDETKDAVLAWLSEERIQKALILGGLRIEHRIKSHGYCPRRSGRLASSHSTNWPGSGTAHGAVESPARPEDGVTPPAKTSGTVAIVRCGTRVNYAVYVNLGHYTTNGQWVPANPYALRAVEEELPRIEADVKQVIENGGKP